MPNNLYRVPTSSVGPGGQISDVFSGTEHLQAGDPRLTGVNISQLPIGQVPTGFTSQFTSNIPVSNITPQTPFQTVPVLPSTDTLGALAGTQVSLPAPVDPAQAKADTTQSEILKLMQEQGGQTAFSQQQEQAFGVPETQKAIKDLTSQLLSINTEAQQRQLELGKTGQPTFLTSEMRIREGNIDRDRTIKALGVSASIQALSGSLELANQQVARAVDLKFSPIEQQLKILQQQYQFNRESLSAAEKKRGDELDFQRKLQIDALQEQKAQEKQNAKFALDQSQNYPDARISPMDSPEVVNQKVTSSASYKLKQQKLQPVRPGGPTTVDTNGNPVADTTIPTINGKPRTDVQNTALGYAQRMQDADSIIGELGGQFTGWTSYISGSGLFPNTLKSEDRQKFEQAQRNFINSVLRKESGAAISPSEFDSAAKQYFPQPGDSKSVIEQKNANRQRVIQSFLAASNTAQSSTSGTYEDYLNAIK